MCGNSKAVTHTHTHTGLAALTWCYLRIQLPSPGPACGWDADADVWGKNRSKKKKKKRRSGRGHTTLFLRRPGRPSVKLPFSFIPDCLFLQNEFSKTDFCQEFSCVGFVTASSHPPRPPTPRVVEAETFSVLDVRTVPLVCREEDCGKSAPGHLLDKHQGAAADQIELNHNKLTRLWPTQIRT